MDSIFDRKYIKKVDVKGVSMYEWTIVPGMHLYQLIEDEYETKKVALEIISFKYIVMRYFMRNDEATSMQSYCGEELDMKNVGEVARNTFTYNYLRARLNDGEKEGLAYKLEFVQRNIFGLYLLNKPVSSYTCKWNINPNHVDVLVPPKISEKVFRGGLGIGNSLDEIRVLRVEADKYADHFRFIVWRMSPYGRRFKEIDHAEVIRRVEVTSSAPTYIPSVPSSASTDMPASGCGGDNDDDGDGDDSGDDGSKSHSSSGDGSDDSSDFEDAGGDEFDVDDADDGDLGNCYMDDAKNHISQTIFVRPTHQVIYKEDEPTLNVARAVTELEDKLVIIETMVDESMTHLEKRELPLQSLGVKSSRRIKLRDGTTTVDSEALGAVPMKQYLAERGRMDSPQIRTLCNELMCRLHDRAVDTYATLGRLLQETEEFDAKMSSAIFDTIYDSPFKWDDSKPVKFTRLVCKGMATFTIEEFKTEIASGDCITCLEQLPLPMEYMEVGRLALTGGEYTGINHIILFTALRRAIDLMGEETGFGRFADDVIIAIDNMLAACK